MKWEQRCSRPKGFRQWSLVLILCTAAGTARQSRGQSDAPEALFPISDAATTNYLDSNNAAASSGIVPTSCSSCGGGLLTPNPTPPPLGDGIPCAVGCSCAQCYPGQIPCDCCGDPKTFLGRFLGGLYRCICCPDPCYLSTWRPLANAAFFVDQVKPITQIRLRGDFAGNYQFPDKAEYFWAEENVKGPRFPGAVPPGGKAPGESNLNYNLGSLYMEGAVNRFSMFINLQYLNVLPTIYPGAAGFGDMQIGTKSLLLDCELIQFTFQFQVFIPTGNFTAGLGTGHVSLDPSLIAAIKLTPITYLQAQTAYWFPIGGDRTYQGPVFNWQLSLNQLLWHCGCAKDVNLIGTAELGGYGIAGGAYTAPITGLALSARDVGDIVNIGPGLRLVVCNKVDIGCGSQFAITADRMAAAMARVEFRWRF